LDRLTAPEAPQQAAPAGDEPERIRRELRAAALGLGFARVGFAPAEPFETARAALSDWVGAGRHGGMAYLSTTDDRADPTRLLHSARTVVSVALPYDGASASVALRRNRDDPRSLVGTVARYARGADYHRVLKDKLYELARAAARIARAPVACRVCVDTAPLLEREAARRAGIGFIGKSTMTIVPGVGTFVLLGELLLDMDISKEETVSTGCGRCTACIDACPTGAFVGPYVLDARRCISYLTIETKGSIPRELRSFIGNRVFGCDVCQDVCPFNASETPRPGAPELRARPELDDPGLVELLNLSATGYRRLVRRTALRRVGKRQLQRNAAVALGNSGSAEAVPALCQALLGDASELVRAHAAWALGALGALGGDASRRALERAAEMDPDETVREEARLALSDAQACRAATPSEPTRLP
jgi:epoxyqueuosine reductase